MRRIGIVGTENSHVDHFVRYLNTEDRHPGNRVTALVGGTDPATGTDLSTRNAGLAETGGIDLIVDRPTDLIGSVDAVIITSRDGRQHRAEAEPLLRAGLPVLVDKPLATTVEDAQAIIAAARNGGAVLHSCSPLRHLPDLAATDARAARHLVMTGPADPASPYAGLFFYGIHHVDTVLALLGDPVITPGSAQVDVDRDDASVVAQCRAGDTTVTFAFVTGTSDGQLPFHLQISTRTEVTARALTLPADYNAPTLAAFLQAVDTGRPVDETALLSPIVLLAEITAALR